MGRRRRLELEGLSIWLAPPEYVILRKLEYYREGKSDKHLTDIAGMLVLCPDQIDMEDLQIKIETYGLIKEWEEVQDLKV